MRNSIFIRLNENAHIPHPHVFCSKKIISWHKKTLPIRVTAPFLFCINTHISVPSQNIARSSYPFGKTDGQQKNRRDGSCRLLLSSDIEGMVKAGIPALSEDGKSVMNTRLCKEAMEVAEKFNVPIFAHCEDIDLRGDGCMNEDENARRLGLPGICNAVEDVIAARDILLARETGARLHLCHCSTEGDPKMMEIVKEEGLDNITAEVCPHHFILTSDDIKCDDPNYKMNPPLRTKKDVDALIRGLKDGSFKVISTDHAPHAVPEKTGSIRNAAFGIVGIETSFALSYTALVETGILTISQLIEKMSWNPAQILGSDRGTLQKGHPADIVIADIDHEYKIDKNEFASKGRNTPFDGWKVKGKILYTICDGKVVYQNA